MSVEIVEYKSDRFSELRDFLNKWSPDHPELALEERIEWQRRSFYLAINDGKIVGCIGQIPHIFHYGDMTEFKGKTENIGWAITLVLDMSDNDIRKQAGRALLSVTENSPPLKYGGVGMVPGVDKVYIRRGHTVRSDCSNMYGRFSKAVKVLKYMGKPVWFAPAIKLANIFMFKRKSRSGYTKEIKEFDKAWDSVWHEILLNTYELFGERNADYLNYKLSQPGKEYKAILYYPSKDSDRPEGYIVFRLAEHTTKDLKFVKICDYVGTFEARKRLISEALNFAQNIENYGIIAIGGKEDKDLFKNLGLYICKPYSIAMSPTIKASLHISFFDSDLDDLW